MSLPNVAVYGNLIWDQIVTINSPLTPGSSHDCSNIVSQAGGLANFCRAACDTKEFHVGVRSSIGQDGRWLIGYLRGLCASTDVEVTDRPTSKAVVIADKATKTRTGMVQWGACRERREWLPIHFADLHHYMYVDRLNINLAPGDGLVTADFCDSKNVSEYAEFLRHVDYLFVSENEDRPFYQHECPKVRRGVIVHSPGACYVLEGGGGRSQWLVPDLVEGLNVVGAGDYFSAYCIAKILTTGKPDLLWAHQRTVELLRRQS